MAAYLMLSGVGRSGSPADRSMMSRPLALSSRAFVDMPMVWEGWMRFTLSAKKPMGCLDSASAGGLSGLRGSAKRAEPTPKRARVKDNLYAELCRRRRRLGERGTP